MTRPASTVVGPTARVAVAFFLTMLATTMPTPLYPLYEQRFGFAGLTVTIVFATYAVGVMAALLVAGRLSDDIGRRPVLLIGVACAAASSVVFLLAGLFDAEPALFVGRLLSGLSAGSFTGVATTTIVELAPPPSRARAGLLAAVVNIGGLGTGPVLAGALARFAPAPLLLPYGTHLVLVLAAAVGLRGMADPVRRQPGPVRLHAQRLAVPGEVRGTFASAATAGFAGFAVLGLFTSVSPLFVGQVLHITDHLVVGLVASSLLGGSLVGQLLTARVSERLSLLGGCATLVVGVVLIGLGVAGASLSVLLVGSVIAGVGQGASFRAGLTAVTSQVPAQRRSGVSSSFFLVLYVAISLPVIGVGAAAAVFGLVPTAVTFIGAVAALGVAAFVSLAVRRST